MSAMSKETVEAMENMGEKAEGFFKKAFRDMKESAQSQHEVDKAQFEAIKAESRANWEEAKAMGKPETRKAMMQKERDELIAAAKARTAEAQGRIDAAKGDK